MEEKSKNKEMKSYKCSVGINYGVIFKMKVKDLSLVSKRTAELIFAEDVIPWLADNVASFWISANIDTQSSTDTEECFIGAGRLKNGSFAIDKCYNNEDSYFEYELPYSEEKSVGVIYASPFKKEKLKTYTVIAGVVYGREELNVIAQNAEDAAEMIMKLLMQTDFGIWKSGDIDSFYIHADEREEDFIDDAEYSCTAEKIFNGCFEVTQTVGGIKDKFILTPYE